jgi:DNA primase
LEQLHDACPIEEIVSSYVEIKPNGNSRFVGLCPFHIEKTPSFVVYTNTRSFYCFGCQVGGDVVSFVKKIENLDYIGALKFLAGKAGIPFPYERDADFSNDYSKMVQLNREAARFFHESLKNNKQAMAYLLQKRQLQPKTIVKFGLGFAPDNWDSLKLHLCNLGFPTERMLAAKLLVRGKNNSLYDVFRNRVMFPIINTRSEIVGFGGRVLGDGQPKYLNSSDSMVFKKRDNLFNINLAKKSKSIILVEGYLDAISVVQAGFENVVATLGTALTENQAKLLSLYADEVILAYDSDNAGKMATAKAMKILTEADINVKVLNLADLKDPDEYIKNKGTVRFKRALSSSVDAVDFKLNELKSKFDVNTSAGKVNFLKAVSELLSTINNRIVREVYLSKICLELAVDKQVIARYIDSLQKAKIKRDNKKEQRELQNKLVRNSRVNALRKRAPEGCIRSEELIIWALYNDPSLFSLLKANCPPEFFTSDNKDIYILMLNRLENNLPLSVSGVAEENELLLNRFSGILARNFNSKLGEAGVVECIDTLRKFYNKEHISEVLNMNEQELEDYFAALSKNKKD